MFENITIEITPKDIEEAVRAKLKEVYRGQQVAEFTFDVGMELQGYGAGESHVPVLRGAKVKMIPRRTEY